MKCSMTPPDRIMGQFITDLDTHTYMYTVQCHRLPTNHDMIIFHRLLLLAVQILRMSILWQFLFDMKLPDNFIYYMPLS